MALLTKEEITLILNSDEQRQIFIDPLLSLDQVGAVSVDLRLGVDFLVSVQTRTASIQLHHEGASPNAFFQPIRRDIGDTFLVHPSQAVLATTLEYIGLPLDVYADLNARSSYQRLGIAIGSHFQPGFRGCASLEIFNHSNTPVELVIGSRIAQARFYRASGENPYIGAGLPRKYLGNVRPTNSKAHHDVDLKVLSKLAKDEWST